MAVNGAEHECEVPLAFFSRIADLATRHAMNCRCLWTLESCAVALATYQNRRKRCKQAESWARRQPLQMRHPWCFRRAKSHPPILFSAGKATELFVSWSDSEENWGSDGYNRPVNSNEGASLRWHHGSLSQTLAPESLGVEAFGRPALD